MAVSQVKSDGTGDYLTIEAWWMDASMSGVDEEAVIWDLGAGYVGAILNGGAAGVTYTIRANAGDAFVGDASVGVMITSDLYLESDASWVIRGLNFNNVVIYMSFSNHDDVSLTVENCYFELTAGNFLFSITASSSNGISFNKTFRLHNCIFRMSADNSGCFFYTTQFDETLNAYIHNNTFILGATADSVTDFNSTCGWISGIGEFSSLAAYITNNIILGTAIFPGIGDNGSAFNGGVVLGLSHNHLGTGCQFGIFDGATYPQGTNNGANVTEANTWVDSANDDFTLLETASAYEGGTSSGGISTDLAGVSRPQGSAYDAGPLERVQETSGGGDGGDGGGDEEIAVPARKYLMMGF